MINKCCEKTNVSKIKVAEKGQQAIILNLSNETYLKIKVDGCLVENKTGADWAIKKTLANDCETLIIELKGTDLEHAIIQINATIQTIKEFDSKCKKFGALIVCNRVPRYDTKVRRGKEDLYKKHRTPLHISSRNTEHDFNNLMGNV